MKNTFKFLSGVAVTAVLLAAGQLQAAALQSAGVVPFGPLTISATGVAGLTATNATASTTNISYSNTSVKLNNGSILAEFYASDYAVSNGLALAAGDYLAVVNYSLSYNSSTIVGYIYTTNTFTGRKTSNPIYATNSLVAPIVQTGQLSPNQSVGAGSVVIVNGKGQVKQILGSFTWNPSTYTYSVPGTGVPGPFTNNTSAKYLAEQGEGTLILNFWFKGISETIHFDFFNGVGTLATLQGNGNGGYPYYGGLVLSTGGGQGAFSNPADAAWASSEQLGLPTVIFTKASATVPSYQTNF